MVCPRWMYWFWLRLMHGRTSKKGGSRVGVFNPAGQIRMHHGKPPFRRAAKPLTRQGVVSNHPQLLVDNTLPEFDRLQCDQRHTPHNSLSHKRQEYGVSTYRDRLSQRERGHSMTSSPRLVQRGPHYFVDASEMAPPSLPLPLMSLSPKLNNAPLLKTPKAFALPTIVFRPR
jgi:hypothetical protein